jgi:hypothetical protein
VFEDFAMALFMPDENVPVKVCRCVCVYFECDVCLEMCVVVMCVRNENVPVKAWCVCACMYACMYVLEYDKRLEMCVVVLCVCVHVCMHACIYVCT